MKQIFSGNSQPLSSIKTVPFVFTKQYPSMLLTAANHWSPCWATRTQSRSSQQKGSSGKI